MAGDGGDTNTGLGGGALTPGGGLLVVVGVAVGPVVGALVGVLVGVFGVGVGDAGDGEKPGRSVHAERLVLTLRTGHPPRPRITLQMRANGANAEIYFLAEGEQRCPWNSMLEMSIR